MRVTSSTSVDTIYAGDQAFHWDGKDVAGEADRVDESDDLEEDFFDRLDDGAAVVAVGPDDDAAVDSDASEAEFARAYSNARALLIQRWNDFTEIERGSTICPFCLAHPWDPKEVNWAAPLIQPACLVLPRVFTIQNRERVLPLKCTCSGVRMRAKNLPVGCASRLQRRTGLTATIPSFPSI
ncbi:hypothetical protein OIDMADRAFT_55032 [Oidiodendron maius Zn]|uniref:Uncharacterized protein n=1 Tax=Oidiodendron maius (strain Zn) TaxID=913774 RepID=A0A0C3CN43_OIDMZ|nr:hypothetical protein OIDMADRAFT_55032 [Oidiodendron maius Zn]